MHLQVADKSSQLKKLQVENASLRSQLEDQCELMLEMADTIAHSHLPRIAEAAVGAASDGTYQRESKAREGDNVASAFIEDYEATISHMDGQHQAALRNRSSTAMEQAEQLRSLENKARKWAKKFLYKVKAAAAKAEAAAGISSLDTTNSVTMRASDVVQGRTGRGSALDTIESVPSPQPSARSRPGTEQLNSPLTQQTYRSSSDRDNLSQPGQSAMQPTRVAMLPVRQQKHTQQQQQRGVEPELSYGSAARQGHAEVASHQSQPHASPQQQYSQAGANGHSLQSPEISDRLSPYAETSAPPSESTPRIQHHNGSMMRRSRHAGDSQMSEARTTPGRRGSALLATVNSHLRRSESKSSPSGMTTMLDSATSREISEHKSKRRYKYFNGLFNKGSKNPS